MKLVSFNPLLLWSLGLLATLNVVSSSSAICTTLPCPERCETFDQILNSGMGLFQTLCANQIDYSFYLPENLTQANLGVLANTLGMGYDAALNTSCLGSIKKDICAKVYLPCPSGNATVFTDDTSWNFSPVYNEGSANPLPFNRSCKSLCRRVVNDCGQPGMFLDAIPDCDGINDETGVGVYSDDVNECGQTSLFSTEISVAEPVEFYLYTFNPLGTCYGLVSEFYTAIWDPLYLSRPVSVGDIHIRPSLSLAPLLPPYFLQILTEVVVDVVWSLPVVTPFSRSNACMEAERMFTCSASFAQPQLQSQLDAYLPGFYLPQRSSYDTCQTLIDTCESHSYNPISVASYMIGEGALISAWDVFEHCSLIDKVTNFSWYAKHTETIELPIGTVTRSPYYIKHPPTKSYFPNEDPWTGPCPYFFGTNYPMVDVSRVPDKFDPWADPAGMSQKWFEGIFTHIREDYHQFDPWKLRVCPGGWKENNPDCPFSYHNHHNVTQCFKSCFHYANSLNSMRDPELDNRINRIDEALLWFFLVIMTVMVFTYSIFGKLSKQRTFLVLSILIWIKTFIDLYGYIRYNDFDRYCENEVVPRHHGWNYCAVSAMINLGLIQPMFFFMINFLALEMYCLYIYQGTSQNVFFNNLVTFIRKSSASNTAWIYYTAIAFIGSFFLKFLPVFLIGEAAGFDGVNSCGYIYYILRPHSAFSPTDVDLINPKLNLSLGHLIFINLLDLILALNGGYLFGNIAYYLYKKYKSRNYAVANEQSIVHYQETISNEHYQVTMANIIAARNKNKRQVKNKKNKKKKNKKRNDVVKVEAAVDVDDENEIIEGGAPGQTESDATTDEDDDSDNNDNDDAASTEQVRGDDPASLEEDIVTTTNNNDIVGYSNITLAQASSLKTPLLIVLVCITFSVMISAQKAYMIQNWAFFTGNKPVKKFYSDLNLLSLWNQYTSEEGVMEMVSLKMGELNKFSKTMIYYYKIFDHVCYPSLLFILFVLNPHIWKLWYRSINKCLNCESETGSTNNLPLYEHESFFISRNINLIKSRRAIKSLIDTFKRRTKLGRVVEETNSEVSIIRSADGSTGTTLTDSTTPSSQNSLISNNSADAELNNEFSAQQRDTEPSSSAGGRPSSRKSSKSFLTITLDKNNKIQNYNHSTNDDASSGGGGGGVDPTLSDRAIATAISELPWEDYQGLFNNGSSTGGGYTGGGDASNKPKKLPPLNIQASFDSQRLNASFDEQSINSSTTNNSLDLDHFNSEMMNQSTDILKAVL